MLRREMLNAYKAYRDDSKVLVQLKEQLKTSERDRDVLEMEAEERLSLELEAKEDGMNCKADVSINLLTSILKSHYKLKQHDMLKTQKDLKKQWKDWRGSWRQQRKIKR